MNKVTKIKNVNESASKTKQLGLNYFYAEIRMSKEKNSRTYIIVNRVTVLWRYFMHTSH